MEGKFQRHVCARVTHDYKSSFKSSRILSALTHSSEVASETAGFDSDGDGETRRNRTVVRGVRPGRAAAARHRLHILITTLHWHGCSDT